jgi:class 3 adenylate cyclase/tetratricopeptide (TPR) repeat protein
MLDTPYDDNNGVSESSGYQLRKPNRPEKIDRLRQALTELRAKREHFSLEAYGEMVRVLLEALRRARTLPVVPMPIADEMRLVTVMFVDVVNSTMMSQELDTGDWKNIISEAHRRVAERIIQLDGQIGQYLGDGVLAFFGAQRSRGDDALRAVTGAVDVLAAVNAYGNEVFLEHGVEFAVRIGISTGRVVVGFIGGGEKQEFLAMGPATNLASRLQSEARPGEIVIDDTTYSRVRHHYDTVSYEVRHLKGIERTVRYYVIAGRAQPAGRSLTMTSLNGIPIPFANRRSEMKLIDQALEATVMMHKFHAITVVGDIGIGKSRLLQEVVQMPRSLPLVTLVTGASSERQGNAGTLLREMLITACNITDDLTANEAYQRVLHYIQANWSDPEAENTARSIAQLGGFQPANYAPVGTPATANNRLTFEPVARWIRALAQSSGLLLVVDNLQWADPASIRMLEYLATELSHLPILLLAAARPTFLSHYPLYMRRAESHEVIPLFPLQAEDATQIIQGILAPIGRVPDTLAVVVQERAEGNPLFLLELLGMLFDQEVIYRTQERWRFNIVKYDSVVTSLPDGLIEVLQARLDDLSPEARQIIQVAAVAGLRFWAKMVVDISGYPGEEALNMLVARGMIVRHETSLFEDDEEYVFQYALYRETAYELLARQRREQVHQQIATWLVTRIHNKPELYPILTDHFQESAQYEAAMYTCFEAMEDRIIRQMLPEALTLNDRGLSLAAHITRDVALPVVIQFWTMRGKIMNLLRRYDEASAASQSALRLVQELPPTHKTMQVAAWRTLAQSYTNLGRYQDAFQALIQAHEVVPENYDLEQGEILQGFGFLSLYSGRLEESQAYFHRALAVWRKAGLPYNSTFTGLGYVALESGDIATALSYFEQVHAYNQANNQTTYTPGDLRNIGLVYMTLLQYERALYYFEEAQRLHNQNRTEDMLLMAYRGECLIHMGQPQIGVSLLSEAMQVGDRLVYHQWLLHLATIRGWLAAGDAVHGREQAFTFTEHIKERNLLLYGRGLMALAQAGHALHDARVIDTLQEALQFEALHGGRDLWVGHETLASACADASAQQTARQQAAQLLKQLGKTLYTNPQLQQEFYAHPRVAGLLKSLEGE